MRHSYILFLVLATAFLACKNSKPASTEPGSKWSPAELVTQYQQGEVERCQYEGKTVFRCSMNAPDAGSELYDDQGKKIGVCYYSTGQVDPPCEGATDCEVVYRVTPNIWGKPGVVFDAPDK